MRISHKTLKPRVTKCCSLNDWHHLHDQRSRKITYQVRNSTEGFDLWHHDRVFERSFGQEIIQTA